MNANAQLKAYIDRILRCREAEDLAKEDTKAVYAELAAEGYEKAIVGQVVTFLRKREKDGDKLSEQSAKFDLYLEAYERPSHAHTRVRDDDVKPRLIKQVVDGMQTEAGRAALVAAVDIIVEREKAEQAEPGAAAEVAGDDLREPAAAEQGQIIREGDAPRETGRFGGDASCPDTGSQMDRATEGSFETGSEAAEKGREAIPAGPEGADLSHAGAGESPATQITIPSDDSEATGNCAGDASVDANTGGSHVTGSSTPAATTAEGYASAPSANRLALRPHCLNPGEACGGWGSNHCHACKLAMKEKELA
ncbi:MAG: hypothetical protein BGO05_18550 [Rhizobiales bacterium 63-7]|nr:DUF2312 domain-containing protein [Hyphomicrobiales bacterium]OJU65889.1 MAG: hypothetical protein BGO05_18550 [Rhizobiales bacterium 63-7]